jgi:hypothetical protein
METEPADLPSRYFKPLIYGVGAWTPHIHFGYDLVSVLKPAVLVELGVDRGESYFTFCQATLENKTRTRCFGIDTWRGDEHAGGYDETTFAQVSSHNAANYGAFSTLLRSTFDDALSRFEESSVDLLHVDGLHTEIAVRHDLDSWLPKLRPGGILLLHDVGVRSKGFGVWKVWEDLQAKGRSWTFRDGPGLGVWQKPPATPLPAFLEQLLNPPNRAALANYYTERANAIQEKIAEQWRDGSIRHTPFAQQTIIQVFFSTDGGHSEENSVYARVGHDEWKEVRIKLPPGAGAAPLRIDFVSALTIIEIESIRVASNPVSLDSITIRGDAEELPDPKLLRFQISGVDPQLYLPAIETPGNETGFAIQLRLRVL